MEKAYPYRLKEIVRWFKFYKLFDGKKANTIHFDDKILDLDKTLEAIHETNKYWRELRTALKNPEKHQTETGKKILEYAKLFHMN